MVLPVQTLQGSVFVYFATGLKVYIYKKNISHILDQQVSPGILVGIFRMCRDPNNVLIYTCGIRNVECVYPNMYNL